MAKQYHTVFFFWVRTSGIQFLVVKSKHNVILRPGALHRHYFPPPFHYLFAFGEEPVTSDVHTVALILYRL